MSNAMSMESRYISAHEARKRLGVTANQWYRLVERKAVSFRKFPGVRAVFLEADIEHKKG
jgi:predicted DNA-binding transcriptional regulator AlpA